MMKKILLSIAFLLVCAASVHAQAPSHENSKQLVIAMSGEGVTEKIVSGSVAKMLPVLKESYPEKSAEFWNKLESDLHSELWGFYISLYQKHLTQQEVDELLVFYSSPLGKKLDKVYYVLASEETAEAIEAWAVDLGRQLRENQ